LETTEISDKSKSFSSKLSLKWSSREIDLTNAIVMGILNITPDSFYDGGKYTSELLWMKQAEQMLAEGATILDIGAISTRPGAKQITENEEKTRLIKTIESVKKKFPAAIISADTYRSPVASDALSAGAEIINDISAGDDDPEMLNVVAGTGVSYIAMHKQGSTEHMQDGPNYQNVIIELVNYFKYKLEDFNRRGIYNWVLDPGFGFGKRVEDNYSLLKHLEVFKSLFREPILAGVSRKSMINKVIKTKPDDALNGTTALNMVALMNGASILRVHDVKEAIETIALYESVINAS